MIELFGEPIALPLLWWLGLPLAGACVGFGAGLALRKDRPDPRDREEASVSKPAAVAAYGEGLDALTPIGGVEDVARIAAIQDEPLRTRATLEMARRLRDQVKEADAGGQVGPLADLRDVNGDDPYNPPRDESRVTKRGDDDDEPPVSGLTVTAVQPRYDWAHLRGEVLPAPGPWRAPLRSPFQQLLVVGLQAPRHVAHSIAAAPPLWRLLSAPRAPRWRELVARLWAYRIRYGATGRHDADRLLRRSWDEIAPARTLRWAAEAAESAAQVRALARGATRRPVMSVVPSLPFWGCTP